MRSYLVFILILVFSSTNLKAQEIDFGDFFNATLTVAQLNPGEDLYFGSIISASGVNSVPISNSVVVTITGARFLDVFVTVTADNNLETVGCGGAANCQLPFTLEASYANLGSDNIGQARPITIAANSGNAQFQILRRSNGAPGPPPTPNFVGFNPNAFNETAYLYLFGSVDADHIIAGSYSGTISITVSYD